MPNVSIFYNPSTFLNNIIVKDTLSIELIDLSNSKSITNSKIKTVGTGQSDYIASKNLINSFPVNPINLGLNITKMKKNLPLIYLSHHVTCKNKCKVPVELNPGLIL